MVFVCLLVTCVAVCYTLTATFLPFPEGVRLRPKVYKEHSCEPLSMPSQARYWILTIPHADFLPYLPPTVNWIRGQLERGSSDSAFLHWQIFVSFRTKIRLGGLFLYVVVFLTLPGVKSIFGSTAHCEPTRSDAAEQYVWKEDTRVDGTQFDLGARAVKRNNPEDWTTIRDDAKRGRLDAVPPDIYVRCYNQLRRIESDNLSPVALEREIVVYWGGTGLGKSRRAWNEAGVDAYPKDPRTKFWCAYRGHEHVVIDEFRGGIDIGHVLRWFDRYPVLVELKGGATVFAAKKIWITSNLHPKDWYPDLDEQTLAALLRRLVITHFVI